MKVTDRRHSNVMPLPNRDEVAEKRLHLTACAQCSNTTFHIYKTQAHAASKHGAVSIRCAECGCVIVEQA